MIKNSLRVIQVLLLTIVVTVFLTSCGSGGSSSDGIGSDGGAQSVWRLSKIEYDYDNDGIVDYVETNIYDANGNLVKWEQDYGNDGTDIVENYTYDTNGTLIKWEQDGAVAYIYYVNDTTIKWEYDDNDVTTYIYDANGNMIKNEHNYNLDRDYVETYTYDTDGKLIKSEYDSGNDGTIDRIKSYIYGTDGKLIKSEQDYGNDGTIDGVETYTYDADGKLINSKTVDSVARYIWEKGPCSGGWMYFNYPEEKALGLVCN